MKLMLEKNKEEDRKTAESRKQRIKVMLDEVKVSNKAVTKMKDEASVRDKERDAEIDKYNKNKIEQEEIKMA